MREECKDICKLIEQNKPRTATIQALNVTSFTELSEMINNNIEAYKLLKIDLKDTRKINKIKDKIKAYDTFCDMFVVEMKRIN